MEMLYRMRDGGAEGLDTLIDLCERDDEIEERTPSDRVFHRRTITLDILSEDPIDEDIDLHDLAADGTDGIISIAVTFAPDVMLTAALVVSVLNDRNEEASFFDLDEDGNELD